MSDRSGKQCKVGKYTKQPWSRHGMSRTRVYQIWIDMLRRCFGPQTRNYPNWGGRGITVCERWRSFVNFLADMGEPPPDQIIHRINGDGNYEPGNCVWATRAEQR